MKPAILGSYIIVFLLFVLPFVIFPFGTSIFETSKIIAAEIAIELLLVIKIFDSKFSLKNYSKLSLTPIVIIIFLSIFHLLFLNGQNMFFGNIFRSQGIFLLWHFITLAVLSSSIQLKINPLFPWVSIIVLAASTVFFGNNLSGRAIGALGEPNALSATTIFLWPFLYYQKKPFFLPKILSLPLTFLLPSTILILTNSRSAVVAFLLQILFIVATKAFKFPLKKTVVIAIVILLLSYVLPFIEKGKMFENRSDIWKTAITASLENPVVGGGFGNTEELIHTSSIKLNNFLKSKIVDSSHNIFIDWFLQGGIIALASLILLISLTADKFIKTKNHLYLIILIGMLAVLSFNPASVTTLVAFWWILGQGLEYKAGSS